MPDIYFLNGKFVPLEEATVSVNDRGYQFGDGVYEVIRSYGGEIFHLNEHLSRFEKSAWAIEISLPASLQAIGGLIEEAYRRSRYPSAKIYVQLTRGVHERNHLFPLDAVPTLLITVLEIHPPDENLRKNGVALISVDDIRWNRCDIKSLNLLPNVLAFQKARKAGVFEALQVRNDRVTEGSISNFFMVSGGALKTHPLGPFILPGVTRDLVLHLAREAGIRISEAPFTLAEVYDSDEAFICGTTIEILPVAQVDSKKIGKVVPGDVTRKLIELFNKRTRKSSPLAF
ncbi:MAG TPA: D-amino-acid transaminase [Nitrospiria bacterium]|nr:D-amino-acid transaminase [Nitrospiria bacterium]